ncbi:MAG: terminase family protein, partial [Clostridia bacterium]|nr:terminase family protein [Clostridia bacterium]
MLTQKQITYLKTPPRRWNVKTGAVRSGKTYCDYFVIPMRISSCPENGTVVLLGYTVGTLCRNVIDPMRGIWGDLLVGYPTDGGTVELFGRTCWLIGAGKADQAEKLRGCSVAYAYGDEITSWSEEVFEMLKSRLDLPGSVFDGTCNPADPRHWFHTFLKSGADLFLQEYVIDDNPALSPEFVESLKKEYAGTPYYDRYILGRWVCPDGLIYRRFAEDPGAFFSGGAPFGLPLTVGVDFGGTKSGTAFVACRPDRERGEVWCVGAENVRCELDCEALCLRFSAFLSSVRR